MSPCVYRHLRQRCSGARPLCAGGARVPTHPPPRPGRPTPLFPLRVQTPAPTLRWCAPPSLCLVRTCAYTLAFTRCCYYQYCMVYGMQRGGRRGARILPNSRAIVLQQCGQCRWTAGTYGCLMHAQKHRSKRKANLRTHPLAPDDPLPSPSPFVCRHPRQRCGGARRPLCAGGARAPTHPPPRALAPDDPGRPTPISHPVCVQAPAPTLRWCAPPSLRWRRTCAGSSGPTR